jgi:hypothetical protein
MDVDETSLHPQGRHGGSSSSEVRAAIGNQVQLHTNPPILPVMPPANMQDVQRGPSPLFEPDDPEHGGHFQDVLTYLPTNESSDEAVEFDEPVDTLNQTKGPHQFRVEPRNISSTRNGAYSKIVADDNRSAALNRAFRERSSDSLRPPSNTPDQSPITEFSPFLDEDPNDDDFQPSQSSEKRKGRTKSSHFAPLYSDDEDEEIAGGSAKRKRNRYPLMANLEVDREKYDFRLPYYLSIRRSLRGRHWTRAPVKLGTERYIINSPLIRPLKAESIPAKQFHNKVAKGRRRSRQQPIKKKSHGKVNSFLGFRLFSVTT